MQNKQKVLVSAPLADDLLGRIEAEYDVVTLPSSTVLTAETVGEHADIVGWLTTVKQPVTASVLAELPSLKTVSNYAVGYDNIEVPAATERGVQICNTPGVLDDAVAALTVGAVLNAVRGLSRAERFVRAGQWVAGNPFPLTTDVHGKTVGILGLGRIGKKVAPVLHALGMDVTYHNRTPIDGEVPGDARYVSRDDLFAQSDVVIVLVPLDASTAGSIGAAEFAAMKESAFFVNPARGTLIDEPALVDALRSGAIAGAALDVMTTEPLPAEDPLMTLENVVLLPHIGSATVETRCAMADLAVQNLLDTLAGEQPKGAVNELKVGASA
ncbi:D-glycerate dehydrogenase [Rhodococcus rhodnii]|uniref:D-3-phosphoglycerate dehydrogenase n=2 Tax=Rhodococcus rhodnii TaxID=38312 RepID=R7WI27_9NOCA|nr:D-glycerate dehydrogenase [Rhodococcus rhodnii]EOM74816.1 D-3-phosphoglycerate dehydrogenase [Rhodococcus rhodnii LMG 5362]TXG90969.1 D-glycerate dehydrogenase [Rhodococcus rhodnii]